MISTNEEAFANWAFLQQISPQLDKGVVEIDTQHVPDQHYQGDYRQLPGHVRVLDQEDEEDAVKDESSPEDVREGVDEPGNSLVGSNDCENCCQSSQAVDPDDPSRSQLDVRSDLRPRHLSEVAHLQHQRIGLVGPVEKERL